MNRRFELDIDAFIQHVKSSHCDSALLIRPNNPTGSYVSKAELTYFLESMRTLNLVMVDESFIEFVDAEPSPSALDLIFEYSNLMIVKSLSKNYGIPGVRLGYAATGSAERLALLRSDLPIWNINSVAQFFLEQMGGYRREFTESCRNVCVSTSRLLRELEGVPFLYPYPTQGNFVLCWILYGLTAEELTNRLFEHSRALINDCGSKDGLDDSFVRIASRTQKKNTRLVEALKDIGASLQPSEATETLVRSL